jgi:hypothetical protein
MPCESNADRDIDSSRNWRCRLRWDYHVETAMMSVFRTSGPELVTPSSPGLPPSPRPTFSPLDILPAARTNPVNLFRILRNPAARRPTASCYKSLHRKRAYSTFRLPPRFPSRMFWSSCGCGSLLYVDAVQPHCCDRCCYAQCRRHCRNTRCRMSLLPSQVLASRVGCAWSETWMP